jgi:hypothetical protein
MSGPPKRVFAKTPVMRQEKQPYGAFFEAEAQCRGLNAQGDFLALAKIFYRFPASANLLSCKRR